MARHTKLKLNAPDNSLVEAPMLVHVANQSCMQITKMCILNIEVYLCNDAKTLLYLSKEALVELRVISPEFPDQQPTGHVGGGRNKTAVANVELMHCKCNGMNRCMKRKK